MCLDSHLDLLQDFLNLVIFGFHCYFSVRHILKIINLDSNVIKTPIWVVGFILCLLWPFPSLLTHTQVIFSNKRKKKRKREKEKKRKSKKKRFIYTVVCNCCILIMQYIQLILGIRELGNFCKGLFQRPNMAT